MTDREIGSDGATCDSALTAAERRVLAAIDMDALTGFLQELVRIPSRTGSELENVAQEHVAAWMRAHGLAVDCWELDFAELERDPAYSAEYDRKRGLGVAGAMGNEADGKHLILNGHVDVVPEGDVSAWRDPPFDAVVRGGAVYGRGALDMKGGLCCGLFAAKAIGDADVALDGRLTVLSVIGEEDGGVGTLAAARRGYRADGAVVMEPTDLAVVPLQAGALNFRVTVPGRPAHGAVRDQGVSAIEKFFPLYEALMRLERRRNEHARHDPLLARYEQPYPICIGTVRGGEWASSVAGELMFEGRFGVSADEDLATARRSLEQAVAEAADGDDWLRAHRPTVAWWGGRFEPGRTAMDHPIVETVTGAYRCVQGRPPRVEGVPYGADMGLLVNQARTPTVLFGPGDVAWAHRPNEHIAVADLHLATQCLALTALRFCGTNKSKSTSH